MAMREPKEGRRDGFGRPSRAPCPGVTYDAVMGFRRHAEGCARWCVIGLFALVSSGCDSTPVLKTQFWIDSLLGRAAATVQIDGVGSFDMFLDPDSIALTPILMEDGIWERSATEVFAEFARPGDVAVDAGANVGYFTLLFARLVGPTGRVYAFEPDPSNYEILVRNVRLNGFTNVVVEQKALSNEPGSVTLFMTDEVREDSRILQAPSREVESVEVEAVVLDEYLAGREERVDLVKIDTQGAEGMIIDGMAETNRKNDLLLMIEWTPSVLPDFGYEPEEVVQMLRAANFVPYRLGPRRVLPDRYEKLLTRDVWGGSVNLLLVKKDSPRRQEMPKLSRRKRRSE